MNTHTPRLGRLTAELTHDLHRARFEALLSTGLDRGELRLLRTLDREPGTLDELIERRKQRLEARKAAFAAAAAEAGTASPTAEVDDTTDAQGADEPGGRAFWHRRGPRPMHRGAHLHGRHGRAHGRGAFGPHHGTPRFGHPDSPAGRKARLQHRLHRFVTLGLATTDADGRYQLTAQGEAALTRAREAMAQVRSTVTANVSEADLATTIATLQTMRANLQR